MNKMVVITGAAGGLGVALTRKYVNEGWTVTAVDVNAKRLEALKNQVTPLRLRTVQGSIASPSGVGQVLSKINKPSWRALINNAGVSVGGDAYNASWTDWKKMLDVNLSGSFLLSQAFLNEIGEEQGSIVNITSMVGIVGAKKPGYAASKAGMIGLTKSFALQSKNVRVNAIAPGAMDTPMTYDWDEAKREKIAGNTSVGYIANPEEIANIAYFLTSSKASYIDGAVINATGGQYVGPC